MRIKQLVTGALLLAVSTFGLATGYATKPPIYLTPNVGVSANATGYWRNSNVIGFEFSLVSGRYYVNQYSLPTCGMVLRIDAAIPKQVPNDSFYGRAQAFDSTGAAIPYGQTLNLVKVYRPGLVGTIRIDSYDAATDTLVVTVTSGGGGPNGTFTMYRDSIAPFTVSMPPCYVQG